MMLGWLGWTIVYAVVIWGVDTAYGLLGPWLRNANERARKSPRGSGLSSRLDSPS